MQVQSNIPNVLPAGGHQGYGACGGLYAQSAPLLPHMYGSLSEQRKKLPVNKNVYCTKRIALEIEFCPPEHLDY